MENVNQDNYQSDEIITTEIDCKYVYCWGFGKYGQIGKKFINYSLMPIFIDIDKNEEVFLLSAGEFHSSILTLTNEGDSKVYMFGKNTIGQLGIDNSCYNYLPVFNNLLSKKVVKVACGGDHTLLMTQENELYSFGLNAFGQLGTGNYVSMTAPTMVELDDLVNDISAGAQHSMILSNSGYLYTCGYAANKSLGYYSDEDINTFTKIPEMFYIEKIDKIACGVYHSACIIDGQKVVIWGVGEVLKFDKPTLITINSSRGLGLKDIKIGEDFMFILTKNGDLYGMGTNSSGQLGNKNISSSSNLIRLEINMKFKQIELGYNYALSVSEDNNVYGWGNNQYGQLTLTNTTFVDEPTFIDELSNLSVFKLTAGGYHAMGIFSININNLENNLSKLEANDQKLVEYRKLIKQNMLASTLRNDTIILRDKQKIIDHFKSNIHEKITHLKAKDNTLKELKLTEEEIKKSEITTTSSHRYSHLTRGFDNNFEIPLDEINFENTGDEIGKGTFGEVRKGVWRKEVVAVKFLKDEMLNSDDNIMSFIDECNMLKNLRHPNILLFMGASTEPPVLFMVTEYCDNGNLFELLHQKKNIQISWEERKRLTIEIATGMNYLHSFHPPIMHRDLKSMNVLLDKNWQAKIADFGSTKFMEVHNTKHKGTFQWMAPEVIKGSTYTEKADVFSFGIVMSEIAMRLPPYYGVDKKEVAMNVMNKSDYRPTIEKYNIPKDYTELMKRCWEQNPAKRPPFSEVIDILNKMKLK